MTANSPSGASSPNEASQPSAPWVNANGRRLAIPAGAVPDHLTPCDSCGRLLPEPGVCGACFGSVGPTREDADPMSAERPSVACVCGHVAKHHNKRRSVYAGLMADYRVVFGCGWNGCGCPEYVRAEATANAGQGER